MAIATMGVYSRTPGQEAVRMDVHARDSDLAYGRARTLALVDGEGMAAAGRSRGGMSDRLFASGKAYVDTVMIFCGDMTRPENVGGGDP